MQLLAHRRIGVVAVGFDEEKLIGHDLRHALGDGVPVVHVAIGERDVIDLRARGSRRPSQRSAS